MRILILFVLWCILLAVSWPLAVLALLLIPLVWLGWILLRLVATVFEAAFAFIKAVLFLPARLLGYRPN